MKDFRYTIYIITLKLPPIRPIRSLQDRIQEILRGELEMKRREFHYVRWQASQAQMDLLKNLENPDYPAEKEEKLMKIDKRLNELLEEYVAMSRYRIPDE